MSFELDTTQPNQVAGFQPAQTMGGALATTPAHEVSPALAQARESAEIMQLYGTIAAGIARASVCPDSFRGKPNDVLTVILRGSDFGLSPWQSVEAFFAINGRMGMYARTMVGILSSRGFELWEDMEASNDDTVTWRGVRPGSEQVVSVTWDIERAKKAGYTNNKSHRYQTNPREMLRAKCQAELSRMLAPDLLLGLYGEVEVEQIVEAKSFEHANAPAAPLSTPTGAEKPADKPQQSATGSKRGKPRGKKQDTAKSTPAAKTDTSDSPLVEGLLDQLAGLESQVEIQAFIQAVTEHEDLTSEELERVQSKARAAWKEAGEKQ